jgi:hypothetical protein
MASQPNSTEELKVFISNRESIYGEFGELSIPKLGPRW